MADRERIERVRQEIMRFRELLTIMRGKLEASERAYERLFADFSEEEKAATKEKDLQWQAAERMLDDLTSLKKAVLKTAFDARDLHRHFEELHDLIVETEGADGD